MKRWLWIAMILSVVLLFSFNMVFGQATKPPKKSPELLNLGKKLYDQNCITCHGPKGDGKGQIGAALKPPPNDFTKPFSQWPKGKGDLKKVFDMITKGIPNTSMVKWDQLPEQERWALTYYVVEFGTPKAPSKKK